MTWGESKKSNEPLVYRLLVGILESILVILTLLVAAGQVIWELLNDLLDQ